MGGVGCGGVVVWGGPTHYVVTPTRVEVGLRLSWAVTIVFILCLFLVQFNGHKALCKPNTAGSPFDRFFTRYSPYTQVLSLYQLG